MAHLPFCRILEMVADALLMNVSESLTMDFASAVEKSSLSALMRKWVLDKHSSLSSALAPQRQT